MEVGVLSWLHIPVFLGDACDDRHVRCLLRIQWTEVLEYQWVLKVYRFAAYHVCVASRFLLTVDYGAGGTSSFRSLSTKSVFACIALAQMRTRTASSA